MEIRIFRDKRVLLGVTGSIASYKAVDLASKLTQAGAKVDTVMTSAAMKFVSPLSFRSVSGRPAYWDMWDSENHVHHVMLGEAADIVVIAPATAHTLAKIAHGLADNLLTVSVLASHCPLLVAPAMDGGMFENPATQENIKTIRHRGVYIAGPAEGRMASGLVGLGRLVEPQELLGHIRYLLGREGALRDKRITVTAGPTQEPLDPVRYLTNRSSGKQGFALAQAALDAGAEVTLISGPSWEPVPIGVNYIAVRTAQEMNDAVLDVAGNCDGLIMTAAVSDFRPSSFSPEKIKKDELGEEGFTLQLDRNPDILAAIAEIREGDKDGKSSPKFVLGFAAETTNVLESGFEKLKNKGLDLIAINDVSARDSGFEVGTNKVVLFSKTGKRWDLPLRSKAIIAEQIIDILVSALDDESSQET
jgi:phosphopantothenoylcysteine decarboxylase/phosphopantothenate--cysteine ligase